MESLFRSPWFIGIIIAMIVFIGIPLIALVRILNRLMRYFSRIEIELRRLTQQHDEP